tara:strand:+ start:222 stop:773 length:552 start_codon:yes stop_codon:yes gene_type:complete
MFMGMRNFGSAKKSWTSRSRRASLATMDTSFASLKAYREMPIGSSVVSLKKIIEKMGDQQELFTDESMTGINKKKWETALFKKAPIHFHDGRKTDLGRWIKASYSHKNRNIMVVVNAKASEIQLNHLIFYLETTAPLFQVCSTSVKNRKGYETVTGLVSWQDLLEYISNFLKARKNINIRIEW